MLKRLFDFVFGFFVVVMLSLPIVIIAACIKMTSTGPVIYWSRRVGIGNSIFLMPKFRSMRIDTPAVATHLLNNPDEYITPIGRFLRKTSLDELPQLYSIIKGDMSFVGPRPALFNQDDLIAARITKNIHILKPGLTGWAQINGRDDLPIPEKVSYDEYYLRHQSFLFDMKILLLTFFKVVMKEGVSH